MEISSLFDIVLLFLTTLLLGVFPIYLVLKKFISSHRKTLIVSIGLSPFLFSFALGLTKLLQLNSRWILIPLILFSSITFYTKGKNSFISLRSVISNNVQRILTSALLATLSWSYFNVPSILKGNAYVDQVWNLALSQEFLRSIPPQYPMWKDASFHFIYHYVVNVYWAGVSATTGIEILDIIFKYSSLISWFYFILVLTLVARNKSTFQFIFVFALSFFLFPNLEWSPVRSYLLHISSCASNFLWGLPIFASFWTLWQVIAQKRFKDLKKQKFTPLYIVPNFALTFALSFVKGTFGIAILVFEITFLIVKRKVLFDIIRTKGGALKIGIFALTSLALPMGVLLASKCMPGTAAIITEGEQILRNKYSGMVNGSSVSLVIFLIAFVLLVSQAQKIRSIFTLSLPIFVAAHLSLYLLLTHATFSEYYFIFNIFILNMYILVSTSFDTLKKFIMPACLMVLVFCIVYPGTFKVGSLISIPQIPISTIEAVKYTDSSYTTLAEIGLQVPENDWVWMPSTNCKNLKASAALNRRIFSECPYLTTPQSTKNIEIENLLTSGSTTQCAPLLRNFDVRYVILKRDESMKCIDTKFINQNSNYTLYEIKD